MTDDRVLHAAVVHGIEEFRSLRDGWDALLQRSAERAPTLTHAWIEAWWEAFGQEGQETELCTFIVRRGAELVGALPLQRRIEARSGRPVRVLGSLSNSWVDRGGILVRADDESALARLVSLLASDAVAWEILELRQRAVGSPISERLVAGLRTHGLLVGSEEGLQSPYLLLEGTWEETLAGLSSSFRQSLRRKVRAAERLPGLEMRIRRDAEVAEAIMAISLESWQHDGGTSMASTPRIRRFYETVIRAAAADGTLHAPLLAVAGIPVAFEFNLLCAGTLHNFKLGYRKSAAGWSPGLVLKEFTLRRHAEESRGAGARLEYDLMGTSELYKLNWTKSVRAHEHLVVSRPSIRARARHLWRYSLKPMAKSHLPRAITFVRRFIKDRD